MKLLSVGNPKTIRGEGRGYRTYIMHLDPKHVVVGLLAKGKAKHDNSNFVVTV